MSMEPILDLGVNDSVVEFNPVVDDEWDVDLIEVHGGKSGDRGCYCFLRDQG